MKTNLAETLKKFRGYRAFDVDIYLEKKLTAINDFFRKENLNAAVLGLSGGIDSSVVLHLLLAASKRKDSPIKHIEARFMPIFTTGTTGQDQAENHFNLLIDSLSEKDWGVLNTEKNDLTTATNYMLAAIGSQDPWVCGQIASIMRTPALYGTAAELQKNGWKSIVVGTTNRDEGSYIGFFGKASDAMVDLQPIADIHKSEVYALAEKFNIPKALILNAPRGDVWDNRIDEEMIGAPYWFLEFHLLQKDFWTISQQSSFIFTLETKEERNKFLKWQAAIEKIHHTNLHKYKVGSPARFIDVMKRKIEGGWQ